MLESGYRISDLDNIPVNSEKCIEKNRIAFDKTYLLGYAHSVYGITYNTHNYKVPLSSLRDDLKGYIGIESVSPKWSGQIKLWAGKWEDKENENNSYTKEWKSSDVGNPYYNPEKFQNLEDTFFIIKDAPYPFEERSLHNRNDGEAPSEMDNDGNEKRINRTLKEADPYSDSHKIVTKKYIDERLAAKRLVEVGATFKLRDYDCSYLITKSTMAETNTIKIVYSDAFVNRLKHNTLEFSLLLEGKKENGLYKPANTNNITLILVKENGEEIPFNFLEGFEPDWTNINLYGKSRYLYLKFRTSTNELTYNTTTKNIDGVQDQTGEKITVPGEPDIVPKFEVFIICENSIYKRNANVITIAGDDWISVTGGNNGWSLKFNENKIKYPEVKTSSVVGDNKYITVDKAEKGNNTEYGITFNEEQLPTPPRIKPGRFISAEQNDDGDYVISFTGTNGDDVAMPTVKEYGIKSTNNTIKITKTDTADGNSTTYNLEVNPAKLPKVSADDASHSNIEVLHLQDNGRLNYSIIFRDRIDIVKSNNIAVNTAGPIAYCVEGGNINLTFQRHFTI